MRVLVLEDNTEILKLYDRIFKKKLIAELEMTVTVRSAIDTCQRFNPEFIISDWDLGPGGVGGDFYDWILQTRPLMTDRFMFCTGDPELALQYTHNVIEKPFAPSDLVARVQEMMGLARRPMVAAIAR